MLMTSDSNIRAWLSQAQAALVQRRYSDALAHLDRVLAAAPTLADGWNNRGIALFALGRLEEGIASFEKGVRLNPKDVRARFNLGNARFQTGDVSGARTDFGAVLKIEPTNQDARLRLAECLSATGDLEGAMQKYGSLLSDHPSNADAIRGLSDLSWRLNRQDEFLARARAILAQSPRATAVWLELGVFLARLNDREQAEECFRRALAIEPNNATLHARIGWAYVEFGDLKEAREHFQTACRLQPKSPVNWRSLVGITKVERSDGVVETLEALLRERGVSDVADLRFALAKALGDIGEKERAFSHLVDGAKERRRQIPYDEAMVLSRMDKTVALCTPSLFARRDTSAPEESAPIFILGMPRTGSTLVEQILAAHPQVLSVGEAGAFEQTLLGIDANKRAAFPDWLPDVDRNDLQEIARGYLARIHDMASARNRSAYNPGKRIVDKTPTNFTYLGLIHLALPNARIIHTRRDPIDTCLSCFETFFAGNGVSYSYDLAELGRYYAHYRKMMTMWDTMLPGSFMAVDYASLVNDFEKEVRRILLHCSLDWDDACLSFHEVTRPVQTASASQVRQPLFSTSVRKWRPSDEILQPLIRELERSN